MADQGLTKKGVVLATGSSAVRLKEKGELLPGRGLEGNEYYIKPLSFREFVLQSISYITNWVKDDEFSKSLDKLRITINNSSINLSFPLEDMREEIYRVIPFKKELGYLFQIYLITGGLPGVVNHYLNHRYLEGKEMIESKLSEIFIRDILGDFSRLQRNQNGEVIKRFIFLIPLFLIQ